MRRRSAHGLREQRQRCRIAGLATPRSQRFCSSSRRSCSRRRGAAGEEGDNASARRRSAGGSRASAWASAGSGSARRRPAMPRRSLGQGRLEDLRGTWAVDGLRVCSVSSVNVWMKDHLSVSLYARGAPFVITSGLPCVFCRQQLKCKARRAQLSLVCNFLSPSLTPQR